MNNLQSLSYFYPEILLTVVIIAVIIYDLLLKSEESGKVGWLLVFGLVLVFIAIYLQDSNMATTLFSDAIVLDPFSTFFKIVIIIATILVAIFSLYTKELDDYRMGEYFTLLGIVTFGLFLMVSSIDLVMVYISIEIVSIMSFVLAGYLKQNTRSNEAALKYVVYGAFSSGIMLFGLSYVYGLTGSTNFFQIQHVLLSSGHDNGPAIMLSVVLILAGFGYKVSAATITAYLSVAPKAGALAMMIRFFNQVLSDGGAMAGIEGISLTELPWANIISLIAVVTMTIGNLIAIQQDNIKRMLAYSSIAHAGYMLLALPVMSSHGIYSIMLYILVYLFMNLGAFFVVIVIKNKNGGESFDDYKGLGWEMPLVGAVMTLFMVSLTGLPPTAGFVGKFYIFSALIKGGESFYWLAIAGGINSVISLYYYLRVVKVMYFEGERKDLIVNPPGVITGMLLATSIPSLLLGIYWLPVANWIEKSLVFFIQTI